MRLSAAALASLAFHSIASTPAVAKETNCRQCTTNVTVTGYFDSFDFDGFERAAGLKVTGGDYWKLRVALDNGVWHGEADADRLCGNAPTIDHTWTFKYFKKDGVPQDTKMRLWGTCGKHVRCRGGSKCQDSEIWP